MKDLIRDGVAVIVSLGVDNRRRACQDIKELREKILAVHAQCDLLAKQLAGAEQRDIGKHFAIKHALQAVARGGPLEPHLDMLAKAVGRQNWAGFKSECEDEEEAENE